MTPLAWRLAPLAGGGAVPLPATGAAVVGRTAGSEVHLTDDTVSRQHAELRADGERLLIKDLGSANGTLLNGVRITRGSARAGDRLAFGSVEFRVEIASGPSAPRNDRGSSLRGGEAAEAISDAIPLRTLDLAPDTGGLARLAADRLARLVDLARRLSGEIDTAKVLATVVEEVARALPADRVALVDTELRPTHEYNGLSGEPVRVPRSIAQQAILDRLPVVTESALDDRRFQSGSVVAAEVRAALAVPLLADGERVLGVLYADRLTSTLPFGEEEAALCFALAGLAAVSLAKAHFVEVAQREALARNHLERFFAPEVAAAIAARQSGPRPGGERRAVTVLFSDIRGFLPLAQALPPEPIAAQLSEYFAAMVEVVFEHGGTLDKFIGDALLAVWGAPTSLPGDQARALAAARAMQVEAARLNGIWAASGRPTFGLGIGLHYGEAFAGMIGSPRRLEYTVIGDVVNVAARLCDAAAAGEIVMSEALVDTLGADPAGAAESVEIRGRGDPILVHRLRG
ncbi:MAG: FHA domain-containing protein [Gemmatimonadales bacterium]|nr:FHA domain-containing protein [Gemmatimonadales bacterium]